jgi:alkylhydroperoxidase family enzyme
MRVAPTSLTEADPDPLVQAIVARRGGKFIELDKALLVSPPFAKGWNAFIGAVRTELEVEPRLRELAMLTVAILNGADYEFVQHSPPFLAAGGSQAQLDALKAMGEGAVESPLFDGVDRAVLVLTIQMTLQVEVDQQVIDRLKVLLPSERDLVELVGVVAAYNMVSRFLVALEV